MKQRWLLIAAAAGFLGAPPANAQMLAADVLPPYEVVTIVRSMGLNPLDRPRWRNGRYVMAATDRSGREVRVVVDASSGQVIRVVPMDVGYYDGPRGYGVRPDPYDPRYAAPPPPPRPIPNQPDYYGRDRAIRRSRDISRSRATKTMTICMTGAPARSRRRTPHSRGSRRRR